jgi:hypothetical protein
MFKILQFSLIIYIYERFIYIMGHVDCLHRAIFLNTHLKYCNLYSLFDHQRQI